jgi:hypothetical protein
MERQGSFGDVAAGSGGDALSIAALVDGGLTEHEVVGCRTDIPHGATLVVVHTHDRNAEGCR